MNENKEGRTGDVKNREKIDNKQLPSNSGHRQEGGILRTPDEFIKEWQEEGHSVQEYHNANHALWYLTMIVHAITHNRPRQNTRQKTERVLAHLSYLREFVQDPNLKHRRTIERIFDALLGENPRDHSQWTHFIYVHWNLIQSFAERYGHREKCFPDSEYQKIADVVHHRHYFKKWWWKIQAETWYRKIRYGKFCRDRSMKAKPACP